MHLEIKPVDAQIYADRLSDFLPPSLIDVHTHIWLQDFVGERAVQERGARWPSRVARDNSIQDLLETYQAMFPGRHVTPLVFGSPSQGIVLDQTNGYVSSVAESHRFPGLLVSTPQWSAEELESKVCEGGFLGLKPYLSFAPAHIPADDITILDFLPRSHLQVADDHGWIVMLHIPRRARLRDPLNLEQMLEIERRYANVRLIVAHIGRAYCCEDVGNAFQVLAETEHMMFDFSANTNAEVMESLIRAVGPQRILFGSDLPILRMRMRRICENGMYVNLVPPGLYGDVSDDPHMREVAVQEGEKLSFFMYEELLAFRRAADSSGLTPAEIGDVFYGNALRLLEDAGWSPQAS
jgi:predicted TIM-barrel fold metal-dependent hydrolase